MATVILLNTSHLLSSGRSVFFTRASAVFGPTFIGFAGHTTFASTW